MSLYTKNLMILLASITLFFSSFYLLFPTLPLYVEHIGGTQGEVGMIVGIFTLSSVLFRPIAGKIADNFGRKAVLIMGALIFLVSPLFYIRAHTVHLLLLVRIFHGIGIAAFATAAIAMIADMSPSTRRGEAFGVFGMATALALSVSPAMGTWVLETYSFTGVFLMEALMAGSAVVFGSMVEETHENRKCDVNHSIRGAILPSFIILLCTVTYGSIVAFLPFFAQDIPSYGFFYTFYAFSAIVIRIPMGRISDKVGRNTIIVPGLIILSASLVILSESRGLLHLIFSGILYGIGFNSVYPTLTALLIDRIPEEVRARGLSFFTASFDLGISIGSFVFGLLPLLWIYPLGAMVILGALSLFFTVEYLK
ncbi:MAG: MFS transporter [Theionarchaea archaeon]|nr:MFS transporter [Theionarchaea archaeon]